MQQRYASFKGATLGVRPIFSKHSKLLRKVELATSVARFIEVYRSVAAYTTNHCLKSADFLFLLQHYLLLLVFLTAHLVLLYDRLQ